MSEILPMQDSVSGDHMRTVKNVRTVSGSLRAVMPDRGIISSKMDRILHAVRYKDDSDRLPGAYGKLSSSWWYCQETSSHHLPYGSA